MSKEKEKPRWIRYVLKDGEDILFVKEVHKKNIWTLPGGGIEHGESVEDASERIIEERFGFSSKSLERLEELKTDYKGLDEVIYYFRASVNRSDLSVGDDIFKTDWRDSENLPDILSVVAKKGIELVRD